MKDGSTMMNTIMKSNQQNAPAGIRELDDAKVAELDVRPILNSGGEPFSVIMETVAQVPADGALRLRATFEPRPLFHVLGKQGFEHWVESGEGDDWIVWFYRGREEICPKECAALIADLTREFPELRSRLQADGIQWSLDVRDLSPPEPMELTLAALERLPQGARLLQRNVRVPQFLLPILEEKGFRYEIQNQGEEVHLLVERKE